MITDIGKYYLYRHIREDMGMPFYIGIGTKRKGYEDSVRNPAYERALSRSCRSNYWYNITSKTKYIVEIVMESNDRDFICEKEVEFVKLYGRNDLGKGTLINLVDGGSKYLNQAQVVIDKRIETKRKNGTLSSYKNLIGWINSSDYRPSKSKYIYLYSKDGIFLKKFNSIQECGSFLGLKGSASWIINACNNKNIYKSKYLFSWVYEGEKININDFNLKNIYTQSVNKVCAMTGEIICSYEKVTDAANEMNTDIRNISSAIYRKTKCKGFLWEKKNL